MIINQEVIGKLMRCFPHSFINSCGEFIAVKRTNLYFNLSACQSELDVKCKVLEWFSRDAYKSQPYKKSSRNQEYQRTVRQAINNYLQTNFSQDEMGVIYTYLGNAIRHDLTIKFVESGYDIKVLRDK